MATIDVGPGATDRASSVAITNTTRIDLNNPANDTGTLDTFEIYAAASNLLSVKIGTFSGSGNDYDDRDYEAIGTVNYGSKQTFTGKNCDVSSGDFLGIYAATGSGTMERVTSGFAGVTSISGDTFGSGSNTYSPLDGDAISIYATGATVVAGSLPLKNVFGRPFSGVFR